MTLRHHRRLQPWHSALNQFGRNAALALTASFILAGAVIALMVLS